MKKMGGVMRKVVLFMRTNVVYKTALLIAAFVFPISVINYFMNTNSATPCFEYMWIGTYSVLFIWISFKRIWVKGVLTAINLCFFMGVMFFFLMGGSEIIPGMILKALLPFVKNPWI